MQQITFPTVFGVAFKHVPEARHPGWIMIEPVDESDTMKVSRVYNPTFPFENEHDALHYLETYRKRFRPNFIQQATLYKLSSGEISGKVINPQEQKQS